MKDAVVCLVENYTIFIKCWNFIVISQIIYVDCNLGWNSKNYIIIGISNP